MCATVTQHDLRDKIGYVPQQSMLFSGTIESNIKYGNEKASRIELEKLRRYCPGHRIH